MTGRAVTGRPLPGQRRHGWPTDTGSATIWLIGLAALIVTVAFAAVAGGSAVLARHRLERGADLSALAAAQAIGRSPDPCLAAARLAAENGDRLVACWSQLAPTGLAGTVQVRLSRLVTVPLLGGRRISARARAGRLAGSARVSG